MALDRRAGNQRAVPEGKQLVGECHDVSGVLVAFHVELDAGRGETARHRPGVQEDPPLGQADREILQAGEFGDLPGFGQGAGHRLERPQPG